MLLLIKECHDHWAFTSLSSASYFIVRWKHYFIRNFSHIASGFESSNCKLSKTKVFVTRNNLKWLKEENDNVHNTSHESILLIFNWIVAWHDSQMDRSIYWITKIIQVERKKDKIHVYDNWKLSITLISFPKNRPPI